MEDLKVELWNISAHPHSQADLFMPFKEEFVPVPVDGGEIVRR